MASRIVSLLFAILVACALQSCASSPQKRFGDIIPGMSGPEVRDTMGAGPTKLTAAGSAGYSSWYWGNDFCVLFHGGKVVGKDRATTATSATLGPGQYAEKRPAQCLAPGEVSQSTVERSVTIPGVGSAKLPSDLRPSDQIGGPTNPSPNGPEPGEAGGTVTQ